MAKVPTPFVHRESTYEWTDKRPNTHKRSHSSWQCVVLTTCEAFYQLILIKCTLFIFAITYEFDVQFPIIYRDTHISFSCSQFFFYQHKLCTIRFSYFIFTFGPFRQSQKKDERKMSQMSRGGLHATAAAAKSAVRKIKREKKN